MADVPLMDNPMTTAGDVIYGGASGAPTRLAVGTAGQVLKVNAGATAPEWGAGGGLGAWTDFSPTLISSGTAPSVGNGTLTGRYKAIDSTTYAFRIELTWGSTSTPGTGNWNFGNLPFTAKTGAGQVVSLGVLDTGTLCLPGIAQFSGGSTQTSRLFTSDTATDHFLKAGQPITWATGDVVWVAGLVEVD